MSRGLRERAGSQLADSFARPGQAAAIAAAAAAAAPAPAQDAPVNRCLVYCRLRPPRAGEINTADGQYELLKLAGKQVRVDEDKVYDYDGTFGGQSTQEEIFNAVGRPNVDHVFKGFCSAIMCYGQTGTGKSFTMCNMKPGQEGIIPRAARHIYEKIARDPSRKYKVVGQFVQIYRDNLGDLLDPDGGKVDLRYDDKQGVTLPGCTETVLPSVEDFMALYEEGNSRRVVTATKMNPESSRGHTALVVWIISEPLDEDGGGVIRGKITFIDLAGYERFSKTGVGGDPIMKDEAKTINASLLALGHVVSALSQGEKHIPWRNAKLTRLLQDSIGGNSRTSIMLTCGPSSEHLHESANTLQFGARAMAVKVTAKRQENVDYQKLATKLQAMLAERDDRINVLELAATSHQMELEAVKDRHTRDMEVLRSRQRAGLDRLLAEGASKEQLERLIKQNEVEEEDLTEQHQQEIENTQEGFQSENRRLLGELEEGHRSAEAELKQRVATLELQLGARDKQLQAAVDTIQQLMAAAGEQVSRETLVAEVLASSSEVPEEAAAELQRGCAGGGGGGADPAEVARLKGELDDARRRAEGAEEEATRAKDDAACAKQAAEDKVEKMKKAQQALSAMAKKLKDELKEAEGRQRETLAALDALRAEQSEEREAAEHAAAAEVAQLRAQLDEAEVSAGIFRVQLKKVSAEAAAEAERLREAHAAQAAQTAAKLEHERKRWSSEKERLEGKRRAVEQERKEMLTLAERAAEQAAAERRKMEEALEQMEGMEAERERLERAVEESRKLRAQEAAERSRERAALEETLRETRRSGEAATAREREEAERKAAELRKALDEEAAMRRRAEAIQKDAAEVQQAALAELTRKLKAALAESERHKEELERHAAGARERAEQEQQKLRDAHQAEVRQVQAKVADLEKQLEIYQGQLREASAGAAERAESMRRAHEAVAAETHAKLERERMEREREREQLEAERLKAEAQLRELRGEAQRSAQQAAAERKRVELLVEQGTEEMRAEKRRLQCALEGQRAERQRLEMALADADKARKDALAGKERHKSKFISDLVQAGRLRPPRDAPSLLADAAQYEQELSTEEVRQFFRYRLVLLGDAGTGKSSVARCLSSAEPMVFKSLPAVVSPSMQWEAHHVAEGATAKSLGRGAQRLAHPAHFEIWDTPCDIAAVSHVPPSFLPCTRAAYLVCVPLDVLGSEEEDGTAAWERTLRPRLESQLRAIKAASPSRLPKDARIPLIVLGTRRDLLPAASRSTPMTLALLEMAVAWLKQYQEEGHCFRLEGAFAVSCKDWTVAPSHPAEVGLPEVCGFPALLQHAASVLRRNFPLVPSAMLSSPEQALPEPIDRPDQLEAWLAQPPGEGDEAKAQRGILTLAMHLHRMRQWNRWTVGGGEWEALLGTHLQQSPDAVKGRSKQLTTYLTAAGLVMEIVDGHTGETAYVLEPWHVARLMSAVAAPHMFVIQVASPGGEPAAPSPSPRGRMAALSHWGKAARGDRPEEGAAQGNVKRALAAEGFAVDQLSTAQWQRCYNGILTMDAAKVIFARSAAAFGSSVALAINFLCALGIAFPLRAEPGAYEGDRVFFAPVMAVTRLTPTGEAWLRLGLGEGWVATAFLTPRPLPLARFHAAAGALYRRFGVGWCAKRDAVVLRPSPDSWGYVQWRPRCLIAVGSGSGAFATEVLARVQEELPEAERAPADKLLKPLPELPAPLAAAAQGDLLANWSAISTGALPDESAPFPDWRAIR
eukprot:TRINITY_DN8320_c0_g1_i1.p1 TRINITY_DN8320_c0_g1~~TRINITY_DN8320_c0_g1_i1.p1  ORF type:complete len:1754 (+),score=710.82 TRINITY_DN8320_c0_g1_i1:77-5338(+)